MMGFDHMANYFNYGKAAGSKALVKVEKKMLPKRVTTYEVTQFLE